MRRGILSSLCSQAWWMENIGAIRNYPSWYRNVVQEPLEEAAFEDDQRTLLLQQIPFILMAIILGRMLMLLKTAILSLALTTLLLNNCAAMSPAQREERIQSSPRRMNGKFVNPGGIKLEIFSQNTWATIKKYMFYKRTDIKPEDPIRVVPIQAGDWQKANAKGLSFSWLGHSSLLISIESQLILVDPVFEERASPFSWVGPKRFSSAPVTAEELPPMDVVLITHDHYDHLEEPTIRTMETKTKLFLVPLGIGALLEGWGVPPNKIRDLDWWESHDVDGIVFTATPAVHYASRGLFDQNKRFWCSWSVQGKKHNFFVSGDSGYVEGFKEIGEKFGPFDLTFLKIGSYDENWRILHMTPEEAVLQHHDIKGKRMIPLHWATFDLALHSWYEPIERSIAAAEEKQVQIDTPQIGAVYSWDDLPGVTRWWERYQKKSPSN